jgi:glycosyltransferase involved in cell wall biosynthesis
MSDMPVASVIIPARNAAATIGEQLQALADQQGAPPFEVLVVDNGSTDATRYVAADWESRIRSLRVIDAPDRAGSAYARDIGAEHARADRLLYCDADDVVSPTWVAAMCRVLASADVAGGRMDDVRLNPPEVRAWYAGVKRVLLAKDGWLPYASGANLGIRADVLSAIGGWDAEFTEATDAELVWRAQLAGCTLQPVDDAVVHYRYRTSMRALARQTYRYGIADAKLASRYREQYPTPTARSLLRRWGWITLHLPDVGRGVARRGRWVRRTCIALGRARGSVRYRVLV